MNLLISQLVIFFFNDLKNSRMNDGLVNFQIHIELIKIIRKDGLAWIV